MFYNERTQRPIGEAFVKLFHGVDPVNDPETAKAIGIFPIVGLDSNYEVAGYEKQDDYYQAVLFQLTTAEVETVRSFNAKSALIDTLSNRVSGLESDSVVDDATDTALITLVASLAQRIQALEEDHQSLMNPQTTDIQTEETSTY